MFFKVRPLRIDISLNFTNVVSLDTHVCIHIEISRLPIIDEMVVFQSFLYLSLLFENFVTIIYLFMISHQTWDQY